MTIKKRIVKWAARAYVSRNMFARWMGAAIWRVFLRHQQAAHCNEEGIRHSARYLAEKGWQGRLEADIRRCWLKNGFTPQEYVAFGFVDKRRKERNAYYSFMDLNRFTAVLNEKQGVSLLSDKYAAYLKFKKYYRRDVFFFNGDNENVPSAIKWAAARETLFVKSLSGFGGHGTRQICPGDYSSHELAALLAGTGPCVLEEPLSQDQSLSAFHPASINTVRLTTLLNAEDGSVRCWFAFLRTGRGNSAVDNASSGGISAPIDLESGAIVGNGYDIDGNEFQVHPDTEVAFKGAVVPRWKEITETAGILARALPTCRYVAWDFAVTPDGVALVEGNAQGGLCMVQVFHGKGMKAEFEAILLDVARKSPRAEGK